MKKVILGVLSVLTVLTFAGCGTKEEIKLDLNKISADLETLSVNKVEYQLIYFEDMPGYTTELEFVYDLSTLGLNSDLVQESKVYYNEESKEFFAVINPMPGKMSEIKNQLNSFMTSINAKSEEINGLLVCAASTDNDAVFKKIKETKVPVFGMMEQVTDESLENSLNIKPEDVEEYLIKQAQMGSAVSYFIIKPSEGKEETIKAALDEQMARLESTYEFYGPGQLKLVQDRKVKKIGDYLIYIVSTDNDLVFDTIKNNEITE